MSRTHLTRPHLLQTHRELSKIIDIKHTGTKQELLTRLDSIVTSINGNHDTYNVKPNHYQIQNINTFRHRGCRSSSGLPTNTVDDD